MRGRTKCTFIEFCRAGIRVIVNPAYLLLQLHVPTSASGTTAGSRIVRAFCYIDGLTRAAQGRADRYGNRNNGSTERTADIMMPAIHFEPTFHLRAHPAGAYIIGNVTANPAIFFKLFFMAMKNNNLQIPKIGRKRVKNPAGGLRYRFACIRLGRPVCCGGLTTTIPT